MTSPILDFDAFTSRRLEVTSALEEIADLASSLGAESLSARISNDLARKVAADRFHLVVVGEFNHGKSSFVNALLGSAILPVGVTPTTAVIHHIEYADEPRASMTLTSGSTEPISLDEVKKLTASADGAANEIAYLEIGHPSALLKDVVLVDTPGVNDLSLQRADITYGYIPRADAVLFLLDAGQVLKESERVFLESKLIAQARDKIVFIVNKADLLDADEREEARRYVRDHLGKIVSSPVVFFVSSEEALFGDKDASGLPELLSHLTTFLAEERGRILLDNALGDGLLATLTLQKGVIAKRRGLEMSSEELSRRIAFIEEDLEGTSRTIEERRSAIREEVSAIKAWASRDFERFRDDVCRQLPAIIDAQSGEKLKIHLGPFLEETFREFAAAETAEVASALEALAEKTIALVREDARSSLENVAQALGDDVKTPTIEVDTFAYDLGISALFTMGVFVMFGNVLLGGLLALAAPVLAVYLRDKVESEVKKRAKELAPAAFRLAVEKVFPKLDTTIDDFASRLEAWVLTAGEELHREILEVLIAARDERSATEGSNIDALAACERDTERLEALRARLESMRSSLWTNSDSLSP